MYSKVDSCLVNSSSDSDTSEADIQEQKLEEEFDKDWTSWNGGRSMGLII